METLAAIAVVAGVLGLLAGAAAVVVVLTAVARVASLQKHARRTDNDIRVLVGIVQTRLLTAPEPTPEGDVPPRRPRLYDPDRAAAVSDEVDHLLSAAEAVRRDRGE